MPTTLDMQYPHSTLTAIEDEPTTTQIRKLTEEVISNFGAVYSRSNAPHGLMGEVLTDAEYAQIAHLQHTKSGSC